MLKNLYVIVGRSGTGKTTLVNNLKEKCGYIQAESYTDRMVRYDGETGHHFLTKEEYDKLSGKILETVFDTCRYTMTEEMLNESEIIVLDPAGIKELKETYTGRPVCVIGIEAGRDIIYKRMKERGNTGSEISQRIEHDDKIFAGMEAICDIIIKNNITVNDMVNTVIKCISNIENNAE